MSSQRPVDEKGLNGKAIVAFCESFLVSRTNTNLIIYIYLHLHLGEICVQCICYIYFLNIYAVYYVVIYEGYMGKIYTEKNSGKRAGISPKE